MIRMIVKSIAYMMAPRATFTLTHPRAATRMMKARWDLKHALAPRISAVGAAIVALPVGFAIGRALASGTRPGRLSRFGSRSTGMKGGFVDTETILAD